MLRFLIASIAARGARAALKLMRRQASYLPGKIALAICPDFMARCARPPVVIAVTGTNGKTTTSNLIADCLERLGKKVLGNRYGSNIAAGICSTLIDGTTFTGKLREAYDAAVFEVDERSSRLVYPYVEPDYLLVTNIFRDSMYRNAHAEYISNFISSAVPAKTVLILNADDLIASSIAPGSRRVYFGVGGHYRTVRNTVCDIRLCPECGAPLLFTELRYNHIGRAECTKCRFRSPACSYTGVMEDGGLTVGFNKYPLIGANLQNMYNELSAITVLSELGFEPSAIAEAISNVGIIKSRFDEYETESGKKLHCIMAKGLNPVAVSGVFDLVRSTPGRKAVLMMLDDVYDEKDSSENIAWIYDTDFEFLSHDDILTVAAAGPRHLDYRLRMLIAGIDPHRVVTDASPAQLARLMDLQGCDSVFLLFELYRKQEADAVRDVLLSRLKATEV